MTDAIQNGDMTAAKKAKYESENSLKEKQPLNLPAVEGNETLHRVGEENGFENKNADIQVDQATGQQLLPEVRPSFLN